MPHLNVIAQRPTKVQAEILIAGLFQDDRPLTGLAAELDWVHDGIISRLILRGTIRGELRETTLLASQRKTRAQKILLIGLGKKAEWTAAILEGVCSHIDRILSKLHVKDCALEVFGLSRPAPEDPRVVDTIRERLGQNSEPDLEVTLFVPDEDRAQRIRQHLRPTVGIA
jgi:Cytosol aminopeptidase family, N-terminal domain